MLTKASAFSLMFHLHLAPNFFYIHGGTNTFSPMIIYQWIVETSLLCPMIIYQWIVETSLLCRFHSMIRECYLIPSGRDQL
ncbi:hypothetical protein QVD17_09165 [Tagetes erecta]|uniref:Uncharacterized protein n=1 Tax=Tagetes erecta TaxID=13708 RepID=A0AAD8NY58_TARER|nr:hypothetical protein QVD17_09165 [Tagetes erecta]